MNISENSIISNYFNLTGRPIATMSVAEYLEFCNYIKDNQNVSETPNVMPKVTINETQKEQAFSPAPIKKSASIPKQNVKESNPQSALSLLQSVSG